MLLSVGRHGPLSPGLSANGIRRAAAFVAQRDRDSLKHELRNCSVRLQARNGSSGLILFAAILALFFSFNRFPNWTRYGAISASSLRPRPGLRGPRAASRGFASRASKATVPAHLSLPRWVIFSVTYLRLVTVGMVFAFLMAGIAEAFLFASASGRSYQSGSLFKRTIKGLAVGPVMNLCSACIVPVSAAFRGRGGGIAGAISMVQGSATLNIPALAMAFFVFTPLLGFSRLVLALLGGLLIGPIVVLATRRGGSEQDGQPSMPVYPEMEDTSPWGPVLREGFREWAKVSIRLSGPHGAHHGGGRLWQRPGHPVAQRRHRYHLPG